MYSVKQSESRRVFLNRLWHASLHMIKHRFKRTVVVANAYTILAIGITEAKIQSISVLNPLVHSGVIGNFRWHPKARDQKPRNTVENISSTDIKYNTHTPPREGNMSCKRLHTSSITSLISSCAMSVCFLLPISVTILSVAPGSVSPSFWTCRGTSYAPH